MDRIAACSFFLEAPLTTGLETTGVRLVVEGRENYLNSLASARTATQQIGSVSGAVTSAVNGLSGSLTGAVVVGNLIATAVTSAAGALVNFGISAWDSASKLQDMRLNIESLTAAEILQADQAANMTEAIEMAGPAADVVMEKLKALSLASPFQYQQIVQAYQLNKAFGQSTEMALDLTDAVTNLAAANKTIPNVIERVTYNFSQMNMTGQITARDMRDLAMAGVDLNKMFKEQLGKSVDEVNDELKAGTMTMQDVSKAFVDYVDTYFGAAAERAARTWSGLRSSFEDLSFFSSVELFSGAMDVATASLSKLFDKAQEFIQAGGLAPLGAGITLATEALFGMADTAASAGSAFYDNFGSKIQETASAAASWGANVVIQLASGIIEGAAAALSAAMDVIASYLSFFLAPGSPPRVAPDIDTWGAEAMGQFLHGMTDTDFSVLNTVGSSIQSALGALSAGGLIDKDASKSLYQALTGDLAKALSGSGGVSTALDAIRSQLGPYGMEVAALAEQQIALAKSVESVTAAETALARARESESQAGQDMIRLSEEYNELVRAGASPEVLAAKRAEFEAAKRQRSESAQARREAEKGVETAKAESDALKEKADLQQQVVQQLIELTRQQQEAQTAGGLGKGGAGKLAGGGGVPAVELPTLEDAKTDLEGKMEEIKEGIKEKLRTAFQPLVDSWNTARDNVTSSWERLKEQWGKNWEEFEKKIEPIKKVLAPVVEEIKKLIPKDLTKNLGFVLGVILALGVGFAILAGVATLLAPVIGAIGTAIAAVFSPIGLLIIGVLALGLAIKTFGPQAWSALQTLGANIGAMFTGMWGKVTGFFTNLAATWATKWAELKLAAAAIWLTITTAWSEFWTGLHTKAVELWEAIKGAISTAIQSVLLTITTKMDELDPNWREKWEMIKTALAEKWNEMVLSVQTKIEEVRASIAAKLEEVRLFMAGVWLAITTKITEVWTSIVTKIRAKLQEILSAVREKLEQVRSKWESVLSGIVDTVTTYWEKIKTAVSTLVEKAKEAFTEKLEDFKTLGKGIIDSVIEGLRGAGDALTSMLAQLAIRAINKAFEALGLPNPFQEDEGEGRIRETLGFRPGAASADATALRFDMLTPAPAAVSNSTEYTLNMTSNWSPATVQQGFDYFRIIDG